MSYRFLMHIFLTCISFTVLLCVSCRHQQAQINEPDFKLLSAEETGLHFINTLTPTTNLNIFHYMYFYNGGGVAVADLNKDGFDDLYFTGNQTSNALYLNQGNMTFKDVTEISRTSGESGWSTGVTVTDINQDGWLDIYVNQVGGFRGMEGKNRLYVWKSLTPEGIPVYSEEAQQYGLDFQGFGTQAGFFDYDQDGDLDMFQLNHSVHHNGTFGQRKEFEGTYHPAAGDRLYRNDNGRFFDVTAQAGILGTVVGYGLGMTFSDINSDGWTDIYITNDFHENDYLYINEKDGTFRESINDMVRHTSRFSMGVDIADINNDGYAEVFTLDMHPEDPFILKSSLGEDDYGAFQFKLSYGYNHQYARNTLQLNNGDNTFSEIGIYSGIHATDWSWACLFLDFDHDGYKDIFVTNGIPKRMNDIDYVNFASHDEIQWKIRMDEMEETDLAIQEMLPEIKLPNKFYRNDGQLNFQDRKAYIAHDKPCFSNGAAYGDFDNDGDLDLVVNNINDKVFLYENLNQPSSDRHYISFRLEGPPDNPLAIGARAIAYKQGEKICAELFPVRGYLSFVTPLLHMGLGNIADLDSIVLIWPDFTKINIPLDSIDRTLNLRNTGGLPKFDFHPAPSGPLICKDLTEISGIRFTHEENEFVEFNREQLIPHMTSTEGPALSVADINQDGLEDFFTGSSKRKKSALYIQHKDGSFHQHFCPAIDQDSIFEDVDAVFADIEKDGDADLIVASGGNEYSGTSLPMRQRLYVNDGNGNFQLDSNALPHIYMTAGCVATADFNGDGFVDIFLGGRAVPWNYGKIPASFLLINDGNGKFSDVTSRYAGALSSAGMIRDAVWHDMDDNGLPDLLLAVEWGPVQIFYQDAQHQFHKQEITGSSGWWNFILPADADHDGDIDIIAGNLGLNSKLKASVQNPVRLYINDFDGNGQIEQIMTYYLQGKEIVFPTHREVMKQLPSLKKQYLKAKDFAQADLPMLVGDRLEGAEQLSAAMFENSFFENIGQKKFKHHALPPRLQFSCLRTAAFADVNLDGKQDLLLAGNFYENNIELGRSDADFGSALIMSEGGILQATVKSLGFNGQVRHIEEILVNKKRCYLIAQNNGPLRLITFEQ